uniref:electron transport complex subunit RsxC n=1 Tax=Thaumasiovibrio subtropicus TaxID=1891207 RepID=UPI000B35F8EB|nr:electron transport complex subunit RsxC [Thaumasiovibrio subtropicus]
MHSIIQQIKNGKLWDFPGGIHPAENKTLSNQTPIAQAPLPTELIIPLKQHIGAKGDISVKVGDHVLKGQALTQADVAMCVPIHAPTSGKIIAIEPRTIAHPSGLDDLCIVIQPDDQDTWIELHPIPNYRYAEPTELLEKVRLSGIAGMGGAGFPTSRKLQSAMGHTELLIINAAECEPYITADDRLMQDYADEVIEGVRVLSHILKPAMAIIAIEDNKPEAIKALTQHVQQNDNLLIRVIPTKYPSGGEKQLIKIVTGKEVPSKGLPSDIGIMMQNVGTTFAVKRAIIDGEPLIERVVTLTGEAFKQPGNVWARIGTPIETLLNTYQYKAKRRQRIILGGPMMGFTLPHTSVPITKTINCILAPTRRELPESGPEMACIRCSACADACPASLLPQQLQWYAKDQDYDKCDEYNLFDCIECGACAYVCPSEIPLVQYYRQAKSEIRERDADAQKAERARQRYEAKQARMERDKQERENRHKRAAADRRAAMQTQDNDAVAAAIERVKAKKASSEPKPAVAAAIARAKAKQAEALKGQATERKPEPDNSEMMKLREERKRLAREKKAAKAAAMEEVAKQEAADAPQDSEKKAAVAAAIARAKARKAAVAEESVSESTPANDSKKDAVAAAVARAKARKAAQQAEQQTEPAVEKAATDAEPVDPKKAAVAAAVARAKARKAAQQAEQQPEPAVEDTAQDAEPVDPKKAAVAAAVARAKARKAAQQAEQQTEPAMEDTAQDAEPVDPKKAAVAAAVARAKARKAAQQAEQQTEPAVEDTAQDAEPVDPKKAAVAAAVARAKARKAAQQAEQQTEPAVEETATDAEPVDPKKAAVAAAVARAKARKAAQQAERQTEPAALQDKQEDN